MPGGCRPNHPCASWCGWPISWLRRNGRQRLVGVMGGLVRPADRLAVGRGRLRNVGAEVDPIGVEVARAAGRRVDRDAAERVLDDGAALVVVQLVGFPDRSKLLALAGPAGGGIERKDGIEL